MKLIEGPRGPIGPTGPTGIAGTVGNRGPVGPTGPQGDAGAVGGVGSTGPKGAKGAVGGKGDNGPAGAKGPTGPVGNQGPRGPQGASGSAGAVGPVGPTGPAGSSVAALSLTTGGTFENNAAKAAAESQVKYLNDIITKITHTLNYGTLSTTKMTADGALSAISAMSSYDAIMVYVVVGDAFFELVLITKSYPKFVKHCYTTPSYHADVVVTADWSAKSIQITASNVVGWTKSQIYFSDVYGLGCYKIA